VANAAVRSRANRRASTERPNFPELREKWALKRGFQIPNARESTGAGFVTDDAFDRFRVTKSPRLCRDRSRRFVKDLERPCADGCGGTGSIGVRSYRAAANHGVFTPILDYLGNVGPNDRSGSNLLKM
jgi:hypothetical protein